MSVGRSSSAHRWCGWYRPHGSAPWQRAVEADDLAECRRRLDDYLRERGIRLQSNLDVCLTTGAVPDVPPRVECRPGQLHPFVRP
jgi:hypothetical protein